MNWKVLVRKTHVLFFFKVLLLILGCFVSCSASFLSAQEIVEPPSWQFFRGNQYDGKSNEVGLANRWPDKGPPVLWSIDLGVGYSGFVGKAGRVYTQYQTLTGQFVVCLDANTGDKVWEHRYAWPYKPASMYPGPRSTPTINGERLFYCTPHGKVGCLDLATGESIWIVDAAKQFGAPEIEFGYACSPVCVDDKIIVPVGGPGASMVALNRKDGSLIWKAGDDKISYCSAYPIEFENQSLVIGYFKNTLNIFDATTGKQLAQRGISEDYDEHSAWPIYREPYLWTSGPFRAGSQLIKLVHSETGLDFQPVYSSEHMSNDVVSCVLVDDHLYGFDIRDVQSKIHRPSRGQFIGMEFVTGEVKWRNGSLGRRSMTGETISSELAASDTDIGHASVITADGKLIMLNDTGELIFGLISPIGFQESGRATILGGEICWTAPTMLNRCVFARNNTKAVCVYLGKVEDLNVNREALNFASDIHQAKFVHLAPLILGTEPKFAMTAPKAKWLLNWFLVSFALGWIIVPLIAIATHQVFNKLSVRIVLLTLTFLAGVFGTTIAGRWQGIFYFSWPIVLYIAFEQVVFLLKSKDETVKPHPILARLSVLFFVALCLAYFWLCRRLSLAFEWTFLLGFPFAIPFLLLIKTVSSAKKSTQQNNG